MAAIAWAEARRGHAGGMHEDDHKSRKEAAEQKKKATITAESFDRQVSDEVGVFSGRPSSPP